jgi:diguanylate cyclase (GGDEF)-like protein/PAS domain S-box-containing protein
MIDWDTMIPFAERVARSLALKLAVAISVVILCVSATLWYVLVTTEKRDITENAVQEVISYSGLIKKSIHYEMLSAQRESIQHTVENVTSKEGIRSLRIYDCEGRIAFSSQPAEIGRFSGGRPQDCSDSDIPGERQRGPAGASRSWTIRTGAEGHPTLSFHEPIYNEPSCSTAACHVHAHEKKVLGVIQTEFPLTTLETVIRKRRDLVTLYTVVFIIVTTSFLILFFWRFVQKPVSLLAKNMRGVARGELDRRVEATSRDEIGLLAETFNEMTETLEKTTVSRDDLLREVAERRRVEEKLSRSERFLETAFDSIRDPFIILDRDYRIVKANTAYVRMRERSLEDLIDKKCHEVLYGRPATCDACVVAKTFLSGDPCATEKIIHLRGGAEEWVEIYTYPVVGEDGSISHVIEYLREATARKLAEKGAKKAYAELDQIFNIAADGMCIIGMDLRVLRVNLTFLAMFGRSRDEVVGRKCDEIFTARHCYAPEGPLALIVEGKKALVEFESEEVRNDGMKFPCLVVAKAFRAGDGEVIGVIVDFKDISERKKMEDELRGLSLRDELTGLYNRRALLTLAEQELKMAIRLQRGLYVLYADLDGFKEINDTLGHKEGDIILKDAADILKTTYRNSDIIARMGGDEFVVVPIGTQGDDINIITGRLQRNIDLYNAKKDRRSRLSMSLGVAYFEPAQPCSVDELLARADAAMYENKRTRKAR